MFSIHRKLFLAWKKVRIVKTTSPLVPFTWKKNPPCKISDSLSLGGFPSPYRYLENPDSDAIALNFSCELDSTDSMCSMRVLERLDF